MILYLKLMEMFPSALVVARHSSRDKTLDRYIGFCFRSIK